MAISPPSDIVLDVARAVEPETLEAARARLASRLPAVAAPGETFTVAEQGPAASSAPVDTTPKAYRKFEAMVLSSFTEAMLPKHAGSVYGEGLAGNMWKSLLSQQLGTAIADRGGIGIASSLLKDHYMDGDTKVAMAGVDASPDKARLDQEHGLSSALVQELQRRLTADLAGKTGPAATE